MFSALVQRLKQPAALLGTTAATLAVIAGPALALPEAEVTNKLDTILMLMAVDTQGNPRVVRATVDGKQVKAYLGAISIGAAEEITRGQRFAVPKQEAASLRFAPVSLAKFNQLMATRLTPDAKEIGVIAPDPAQIQAAETMLVDQQVPSDQAQQIASNQPMVFCPEPGVLVSFNEGPDKGKQFVPCSTEANFVESIVQRGARESPQLAKRNPRVIAIPLTAFITYLRQEPAERVGQLRVVPSGRLIELVQQLNKQAQSAKPATPTK